MFSTSDTIVAIATPPGRGGIGVVRLSGPDAHAIARRLITHRQVLEPRRATFTRVRLQPDTKSSWRDRFSTAEDAEDAEGKARVDRGRSSTFSVVADLANDRETDTTDGDARFTELQPKRDTTPDDAMAAVPYAVSASCLAVEASSASGPAGDLPPGPFCADRDAIDQAVVTYFPAPASYTGEHVVELSAHGSPVVLRAIVTSAVACGARLAEPGEFTLRAFVNGRIDLMQAEAVADLIDAVTPLQARAAFDQLEGTLTRAIAELDRTLFDLVARLEASVDFPEEGYHFVEPGALAGAIDRLLARTGALVADARRGRLIREGLQIAIVGRPNVGKSSLFNALVGASRAIVTDVAGTTRDLVTEVVDLEGLRVTLVDTAGLREPSDRVEAEGVARSKQAVDVADLVLVVVDEDEPQVVHKRHLIVQNKADLGRVPRGVLVSATTGTGLDELRRRIVSALDVDVFRDRPEITNVRHVALVERAREALVRARAAALGEAGSMSEEFVLADLQEARAALEEIAGRRAPEALLEHIFSRFCIGK